MRLIETTTLAMEAFYGRYIPPYAILSHTWEEEEVTLQDWHSLTRNLMKGFHKVHMTCWLAARHGIKYAWVDTCCIDKSNSAELSEAINSMYSWYKNAKVCYAYLSDFRLPEGSWALAHFLRGCRWFHRGWTLQELIAPTAVLFYQHDWGLVGNKQDWKDMLSDVTGISSQAMQNFDPKDYSIAERMSWAAGRQTAREEDKAYCLLGFFNVNMPLLYGEGSKAFRRLQEEIIRTGYDVSIFAWTRPEPFSWNRVDTKRVDTETHIFGALAETPEYFQPIPAYLIRPQWNEVSFTNTGVRLTLELCLVRTPRNGKMSYVLPVCSSGRPPGGKQYLSALGVELRMISPDRFVRKGVHNLVKIPDDIETDMTRRIRCSNAYISIDPPQLIISDLLPKASYQSYFAFPPGSKVVKGWPSGSWNYAESKFMMSLDEPNYGSFLVEIEYSTLADTDRIQHCQTRAGEFMFLFNTLPCGNNGTKKFQRDLQYTIVGYREKQLMLDNINLRMEAGDMDVREMRRTLSNFAIPRQRTAAVPVEGTGDYIYTSVEVSQGTTQLFGVYERVIEWTVRISSAALENEKRLWGE